MKALVILCLFAVTLSLCSCESVYGAWGWAYRLQGGYYKHQRPTQPTLEQAAENLKRLVPSSQPTFH